MAAPAGGQMRFQRSRLPRWGWTLALALVFAVTPFLAGRALAQTVPIITISPSAALPRDQVLGPLSGCAPSDARGLRRSPGPGGDDQGVRTECAPPGRLHPDCASPVARDLPVAHLDDAAGALRQPEVVGDEDNRLPILAVQARQNF